jgi:peptidoglycan-N-acetylglucosamine deacetylase
MTGNRAALEPLPRMRRRRSWRAATLLGVLAVHVAAVGLLVVADWRLVVALMVASHLLVLSSTLGPGSALFGALVTEFDTARREVWLTIDDGPSGDTLPMLDLLDAHSARATFFLVGERAEARPQAVQAIRQRGHDIANHSAGHAAAWFWAMLPGQLADQIGTAQHSLSRITGQPPRLFRSVVGMTNVFVDPLLRRHGLLRIGWTARGFDSVSADPAKVWSRLRRRLRPGAILMLHEGAEHGASVAILGHVLQQLDRLGYRCVLPELPEPADGRSATTSQLLNGVPPHSGVKVAVNPAASSSDASASRSG